MPDCLQAVVAPDGTLHPASCQAIVPWWSFTKTLIAACVLLLSERRLLALDTPLAGLSCTPRQLLQHRAGVGDYGGLADYHAAVARGDRPWPADELLMRIPPGDPLFAPGTGWAYSNVGYLLLRRELERVTDSNLADTLARLVLRPLGLEAARVAESADDMQRTALPPPHVYDPGWVYHGCVIGPVGEAALALHRLLTGPLLAPASREAMLCRFAIGDSLPGRPWVSTGYGLGIMVGGMQASRSSQPIEVAGHSAGGPGSTGAVYSAACFAGRQTAASFGAGNDAGLAEFEVLRRLQSEYLQREMRS